MTKQQISYYDNAISSVYSLNNLPREAYHGNKGGQDRSSQPTPDLYAQTIFILKRKQKQWIQYNDKTTNII